MPPDSTTVVVRAAFRWDWRCEAFEGNPSRSRWLSNVSSMPPPDGENQHSHLPLVLWQMGPVDLPSALRACALWAGQIATVIGHRSVAVCSIPHRNPSLRNTHQDRCLKQSARSRTPPLCVPSRTDPYCGVNLRGPNDDIRARRWPWRQH